MKTIINLINILLRGYLVIYAPAWIPKWFSPKGHWTGVKPTIFAFYAIIFVVMMKTKEFEFMTWWKWLFIASVLGSFFIIRPWAIGKEHKNYKPIFGENVFPHWYIYLRKQP